MSKVQGRLQEVGLLLLLLLLFLWQLSDRPVLAWCSCLSMLVVIAGAVVSDLSRHEAEMKFNEVHDQEHTQVVNSSSDSKDGPAPLTMDIDTPRYCAHDMVTGAENWANSGVPFFFENEVARGQFAFFHRPVKEEPGCPHSEYFNGKKRNWEVRIRITFKQATRAQDLRFGVSPFERLPISGAQAAMQRMVLKMVRPSLGSFYNSPGDDPKTYEGEPEHPITSITVCESDQHIGHTPGVDPPSLFDHKLFSQRGRLKVTNAAAYREALDATTFEAGETHCFGLWGPARFFDIINWRMTGIPFLRDMSLDALNGPPPLVLTLYTLDSDETHRGRLLHVDSRMRVLMRAATWSSLFPPSASWRQRLTKEPTKEPKIAKCAPASCSKKTGLLTHKPRAEQISSDSGCCGGISVAIHSFLALMNDQHQKSK